MGRDSKKVENHCFNSIEILGSNLDKAVPFSEETHAKTEKKKAKMAITQPEAKIC